MTLLHKCPGKLGHAIYLDGESQPTVIQPTTDPWRPARADMSWHVLDEATGRIVDSYHPDKPRHAARRLTLVRPMPHALEIRIEPRNVYGVTQLYPVNDAAKALADIAGTKTLRIDDLKRAKQYLGAVVLVEERHAAMVAALLT